jgi:large subunit ribosomal protein L29
MTFPKYKELNNLKTIQEIDNELFVLQKTLFDLRLKKITRQNIKPHLFSHSKHRIAQLKFKKQNLLELLTKS